MKQAIAVVFEISKSVSLDWSHRDRADRVVVALAEIEQAAIITSDRKITDLYSQVIW